jgi:subtilisin family serine protease
MKLHLFLSQSAPLIRQDKTLTLGTTGQGAAVAVLDTGVDYTQSAFGSCTAPSVPAGCRVLAAKEIAPDDGQLDAYGHGTNVAGIVAGIATGSSIVTYDVFEGATASSDVINAAIDDVITNRDTYNIVAINMSLGGGSSTAPCSSQFSNPFKASIDSARANGILTVAASGNDAISDAIAFPACTPGAVSVGAVYDANLGGLRWGSNLCTDFTTAADQITCFSNSAPFLTLLAPGALITAAGLTYGGTSQATPHVSAAVAVLRAAYPGDTLDQTVARMTGTGVPITDSRNGITTPRLDLLAAVGAINDQLPDAVTLNGQSGSVYGINANADLESGEPPIAGNAGGKSVWWTWQAPLSGPVVWNTTGSDFDTLLAAYTGGTVPALATVAENDNDGGSVTSAIAFTATAGTTYAIAVDGKNAAAGTVALNWEYPDSDGDTVIDALDNCPQVANTDQSDVDGDLLGDVCDPDADNDGLSNTDEAARGTYPLVADTDGDKLSDGQEVNTYGTDPLDSDSDNDGVTDGDEVNLYGIDPNVSNLGDLAPRGAPNGQIDAGDLVVMTRLATGTIEPTFLESTLADINKDGQLNAADLLLLQKAVLAGSAP